MLDGLGVWPQALISGTLAGLVLWRTEATGKRWATLALAGASVWLALELLNVAVPLWRYTLLPDGPLYRLVWWTLLAGGGAVWVAGSPEAMLGGRFGRRSGSHAADILAHLAAAAAWLLVVAGAGLFATSGARFNLPWEVALPLAGVVVGLAGVLVARAVRRLEPLESAEAGAVWNSGRAWAATALAVAGAVLSAQVFSLASVDGPVRDLPGTLPSDVESLQLFGFPTVSALSRAAPGTVVAEVPALDPARARQAVDAAALAMYRGIGVRFARTLWSVGVRSPDDLLGWTAQALLESFEREGGVVPRGAWVEAWVHR